MKHLSPIFSFLLGSAVTAIGFLVFAPPSSVDLAIEIGRKLGLDAAEKRYAEYERGHASLKVEAEAADKRTEAAETSLQAFRRRSYAETDRLKKVALEASLAQEKAIQGKVALQSELDSAWDTLDQSTLSSDQVSQKAISDVKMASQAVFSNLTAQLEFALHENDSLRSQLDLKEQEIVAISASLESWKALAESEKKLRQDAEAYIADVKDSGFYLGVGGTAGYSQLLSGASGPGGTVGISLGWRFR